MRFGVLLSLLIGGVFIALPNGYADQSATEEILRIIVEDDFEEETQKTRPKAQERTRGGWAPRCRSESQPTR